MKLGYKVGLGLVVSYTSATTIVSLRTQYEIYERQLKLQKDETYNNFETMKFWGTFHNPFKDYRAQSILEFLYVRVCSIFEPAPDTSEHKLEVHVPNLSKYEKNHHILSGCQSTSNYVRLSSISNQMLFTWLGQSSALIQVSGLTILTDPIFSSSLINDFGPKRVTPPPLEPSQIPEYLDYILVSHDHPDHLDLRTAGQLPTTAKWVVPSGLKSKLIDHGISEKQITEMDWWEEGQLCNLGPSTRVSLACVPSMHWSGQQVIDTNKSLWCSFILQINEKPILYHIGDTGFERDLFYRIGKKYSGIKLVMAPIGQYCPKWHQKFRHVDPLECVAISELVKAKCMVGIHWGTFRLSNEEFMEPKIWYENVARQVGKSDEYIVPLMGKTYEYNLGDD